MGESVKKIAVVVPRYGQEVAGPVPNYAYELVQKLKGFYSVDVLTTTASDYQTWANHFPEGESEEDGVTIWRFRTTQNRDIEEFEKLDAMREKLAQDTTGHMFAQAVNRAEVAAGVEMIKKHIGYFLTKPLSAV